MSTILRYTIPGRPQPKGSVTFVTKRYAKSANSNLKGWHNIAQWEAAIAWAEEEYTQPMSGPVKVSAFFYFARPKSVKKSVEHKTTKPDADKLLRAVFDSLTGIVIKDDSQVIGGCYGKYYCDGIEECTEVIMEIL